MSQTITEELGINSWLEEELYQQYLSNQQNVDSSWKSVFDTNGHLEPILPPPPAPAVPPPPPAPKELAPPTQAVAPKAAPLGPTEQLMPLRGVAAKIAENMNASLTVPTATSQRVFTVKVIDENRQLVNEHRALNGKSKVSYTHLIAWAIVRALKTNPAINHAYLENADGPFRIVRPRVNLGIAVDVAGKDGARSLMVPNIKDAGAMDFQQFLAAFDDIVQRARIGKLAAPDFAATTISLTNPGTVGTLGSVPRLMPGQGAIIATGAIDYPAEYQGVAPDMKALLGLSKVMMMTCTYDHRVIQGAESGLFLAKVQQLLLGEDQFYEEIYASLKIPYQPVKLPEEKVRPLIGPALGQANGSPAELAKEAAVLMLINAYRVRGHLVANLDPLGSDAHHHPELDPANYGLTIWDLDRPFLTGNLGGMTGDAAPQVTGTQGTATLREILESLRGAYCGTMAVEYMHIQHPEQKAWLQQRLEPKSARAPLSPEAKKRILERIVEAEMFENFLHTRFVGHKRFSMEGGEAGVAILDELVERAGAANVGEIVIGMAHRGRLTVLATLIGKPFAQIFSEFDGNIDPETTQGSGDVKYHLGASGVRATKSREVVVTLAPNPSHLEAVDPVVEGIVRPKQARLGDTERVR
ncbi:MAG: 2-oxo acid dehydrogenase subunit E2, partial [Bryobacteraceae bacterium]|nr:2-oxo acid dehydrogenase subunit E2 [Bryobacteraceae bacterium]